MACFFIKWLFTTQCQNHYCKSLLFYSIIQSIGHELCPSSALSRHHTYPLSSCLANKFNRISISLTLFVAEMEHNQVQCDYTAKNNDIIMDLAKNVSHIEYMSLDIITYIWCVLLRIWLRCRHGNRRGVVRYGKKLALTAGKTKREMKSDVCVCVCAALCRPKMAEARGDRANRGRDSSSPGIQIS